MTFVVAKDKGGFPVGGTKSWEGGVARDVDVDLNLWMWMCVGAHYFYR